MTAVSVIIPCYRAEPHLNRAIKSLLAQRFADWEAIIISDDGVDYSKIVAAAGISDSRLHFCSTGKIGSGPGNARNMATQQAKTDILANLDADDAFAPEYLATMYPLAQEHGMVVSNYRYIDDATGLEIKKPEAVTGLVGLQNLYRLLLNHTYICFLYDRSRVKPEWLDNTPACEDTLFMMMAYDYLPYVYASPTPLYDYYKRAGSITNDSKTCERFITAKKALLERIKTHKDLFKNPCVALVAEYYFHNSLAAEEDYANALKTNPEADFQTFFKHRLGM